MDVPDGLEYRVRPPFSWSWSCGRRAVPVPQHLGGKGIPVNQRLPLFLYGAPLL